MQETPQATRRHPQADAWDAWGGPFTWHSLRSGLVGVAVLVLPILGFLTQVHRQHVMDCGIDAQVPYAKVRIDNLLGGARGFIGQGVTFHFGHGKTTETGFYVPAYRLETTVVYADRFPRHVTTVHCSIWQDDPD